MGEGSNGSSQQPQQQRIDLFEYTEEQLLGEDQELTHYQILNVPEHASQDDIKKAYRRTSLKYHPDKTGRDENDYVFLAVKHAHDTLFDHAKRQAYDSTVVPFDDQIPASRDKLLQDSLLLYKDEDFYDTFGPVFQRNLRFDLRLRPDLNKKSGRSSNNGKPAAPPQLGDADTPLEQVHAFYEYWVHFESWRDFSAAAADELKIDQELENAESRYEKRWYQKEIEKRAKQLKRQEMNRISTLVERAMEADPRLRKERADQIAAKEQAALEKERQKEMQQQQKKAEQERQQQLEQQQAEIAALEKVEREKEKKQLRKARQQLRKQASASFDEVENSLWNDAYDMNQDLEYLCSTLDFDELTQLSQELDGAEDLLKLIHEHVMARREKEQEAAAEQEQQQQTSSNSEKKTTANGSAKSNPWTKAELSALAKAVKKYPPGGASRWDQICLHLNNLCKQHQPRTKEECIEKYNQVARNAANSTKSSKQSVAAATTTANGAGVGAGSAMSKSPPPPPPPLTVQQNLVLPLLATIGLRTRTRNCRRPSPSFRRRSKRMSGGRPSLRQFPGKVKSSASSASRPFGRL